MLKLSAQCLQRLARRTEAVEQNNKASPLPYQEFSWCAQVPDLDCKIYFWAWFFKTVMAAIRNLDQS